MKRTNILAIAVLLLMSLFISSCENEKLEPSPTEQSISPSEFITRSQNAVEKLNQFYRQNSDSELESRSGESFEELWGQPDFDKIISLRTLANDELAIAPLKDLNTGTTHNLMVGWQQSDSIALRLVHDNRTLTDLTYDNTAITNTVPTLFDLYNDEDLSATSTEFPDEGCFELGDYCDGCGWLQFIEVDCGGIGGGGSTGGDVDPWTEPYDPYSGSADDPFDPGNNTGGGGGTIPGGETTDPDCYSNPDEGGVHHGDIFGDPDNPDCSTDCLGYFDADCDGNLDATELCMQQGGNMWDCCIQTNNCNSTALNVQSLISQLNLQTSSAKQQWLWDNPTSASQILTFLSTHTNHYDAQAGMDGLAVAVANSLIDLSISEDPLVAEAFDVMNDPGNGMWNILKDILVEALGDLIKEQLADLIPGGSLVTIGSTLADNLQQGNYLEAVYNAIDIALNEADVIFPAAKAVSFAIGLGLVIDEGTKCYKAFKKIEQLLGDKLDDFYDFIKSKVDDIHEKFQWKSSSYGAFFCSDDDPLDLWDELVTLVGYAGYIGGGNGNELVIGGGVVDPDSGLPNYIPGLPQLQIKFYPNSNTTDGPTIEFSGSVTFKVRLECP